jgi:glyoxalase family protein
MTTQTISGIHHVTAIASDPQRNLDFYTQVLGLRLVKLTINFDDPGTYHLYFGNAEGAPGSILTFFPWPGAARGTVGNGQVSATAFAVRPEALEFWQSRLTERRIPMEHPRPRFGEAVLRLTDPDGMPLELVATANAHPERAWGDSSVPVAYGISGFHSATLSEEGYERTSSLLHDSMGLRFVGSEENRFRYAADPAEGGAIVDVLCAPDGKPGRLGAGTVHHIAWRTPDESQQQSWRKSLVEQGYNVSPVMDRTYFRSIYFREPGGILFEIATDPPGFAADEPIDQLGDRLMLPPWLEPHRSEVEQALPVLSLPGKAATGAARR